MRFRALVALAAVLAFASLGLGADAILTGIAIHYIDSPYQPGKTAVRVLVPDERPAHARFPVVYVLPVEARDEHRYGDGLAEIKRLNLHNKHGSIFVAPSFAQLPWYADHPTDELVRQESHLLKVVLPCVEKNYSAIGDRQGRLLLGFSKSGWGAWSLLLRNPDQFERAAAWDAPLMLDRPGPYGSDLIFGTAENFKRYQVSELLNRRAKALGDKPRLILAGHQAFADDHRRARELLDRLRVPHIDLAGPERKHDWHSGWVAAAVEALLAPSH